MSAHRRKPERKGGGETASAEFATLSRSYADPAYRAKLAAWVDHNGRVAGYVAEGVPVSDARERAAKETLAALKPDLRAWRRRTIAEAKRLFESGTPAALAIDGKFVYVNPAAAVALGKDRERLIGQPASLIELHNREAPLAARVFLSHLEPPFHWKSGTLAAWRAERERLARAHPHLESARVRVFDPLAERPRAGQGTLEIWYPGPHRIEDRIFEQASRIAEGEPDAYERELKALLGRMMLNLHVVEPRHVELLGKASKGQSAPRRRAYRAALEAAGRSCGVPASGGTPRSL